MITYTHINPHITIIVWLSLAAEVEFIEDGLLHTAGSDQNHSEVSHAGHHDLHYFFPKELGV